MNGGAPTPQSNNNEGQKEGLVLSSDTNNTGTRPVINAVRRTPPQQKKEMVHHPDHYGGKENPFEVIKVIRAWDLSFSLGNTVKYIARAGKKDPAKRLEDLHKAMWYLQEEINNEYERSTK